MAIPPPAPAPPPPPPPAAAAPPPPAAAPPAAAPGGDLLSMLAAQMQQFFGPGGAPGLGGQAQNSNQQQQQQQQFAQAMNQLAQMAQQQMGGGAGGGGGAAGRAARGAQVAALPAQPLPGWAGKLQRWWQAGSGRTGEAFGASSVVLGGPEALAAVCQHLGAALQVRGPGGCRLRATGYRGDGYALRSYVRHAKHGHESFEWGWVVERRPRIVLSGGGPSSGWHGRTRVWVLGVGRLRSVARC